MAQLKDIKTRLQTVKSTQKITSAMMLVASAKLRKTQRMLDNLEPYVEGLRRIYDLLLARTENFQSPLMEERAVGRVALVVFSSNTGLAGRFNHVVSAELMKAVDSISHAEVLIVGGTSLVVYPAAGLLQYYSGEKLILVNRSATPYDHRANYVLHGDISKILPELIR